MRVRGWVLDKPLLLDGLGRCDFPPRVWSAASSQRGRVHLGSQSLAQRYVQSHGPMFLEGVQKLRRAEKIWLFQGNCNLHFSRILSEWNRKLTAVIRRQQKGVRKGWRCWGHSYTALWLWEGHGSTAPAAYLQHGPKDPGSMALGSKRVWVSQMKSKTNLSASKAIPWIVWAFFSHLLMLFSNGYTVSFETEPKLMGRLSVSCLWPLPDPGLLQKPWSLFHFLCDPQDHSALQASWLPRAPGPHEAATPSVFTPVPALGTLEIHRQSVPSRYPHFTRQDASSNTDLIFLGMFVSMPAPYLRMNS